MTVTATQFRTDFPAFASTTTYPDGQIEFQLNIATLMLNQSVFGTLFDYAVELYIAHELSVQFSANLASSRGLQPGRAYGVINNSSVDKVSYGTDTASVLNPDGGYWNLTLYGQKLWKMIQLFGAGVVQVQSDPGPSISVWQGPQFGTGYQ